MRRMTFTIALFFLLTAQLLGAAESAVPDAEKFQHEYEILNGQSNLDGSSTYQTLAISADNPVVYADESAITALFGGGSGVLYLGFPECPWCRTLVPALFEAAEAAQYDGAVYYYNALLDRDKKTLGEDGCIVVESEGSELYQFLLNKLYDHLGPYEGLNDETIRRIYFPTTVFVKDGAITSVHIDTVDSQTDGYAPLTDEQHDELLAALTAQFAAIQ